MVWLKRFGLAGVIGLGHMTCIIFATALNLRCVYFYIFLGVERMCNPPGRGAHMARERKQTLLGHSAQIGTVSYLVTSKSAISNPLF